MHKLYKATAIFEFAVLLCFYQGTLTFTSFAVSAFFDIHVICGFSVFNSPTCLQRKKVKTSLGIIYALHVVSLFSFS